MNAKNPHECLALFIMTSLYRLTPLLLVGYILTFAHLWRIFLDAVIIYVARVHLKKCTILSTRPWTLRFEHWTRHNRSLGIRWVTTSLTHQTQFIISTPKKGRFLFTMGLLDWIAHCIYMCVTEGSTRRAWPDGCIWRVHVLKKKKKKGGE